MNMKICVKFKIFSPFCITSVRQMTRSLNG